MLNCNSSTYSDETEECNDEDINVNEILNKSRCQNLILPGLTLSSFYTGTDSAICQDIFPFFVYCQLF